MFFWTLRIHPKVQSRSFRYSRQIQSFRFNQQVCKWNNVFTSFAALVQKPWAAFLIPKKHSFAIFLHFLAWKRARFEGHHLTRWSSRVAMAFFCSCIYFLEHVTKFTLLQLYQKTNSISFENSDCMLNAHAQRKCYFFSWREWMWVIPGGCQHHWVPHAKRAFVFSHSFWATWHTVCGTSGVFLPAQKQHFNPAKSH